MVKVIAILPFFMFFLSGPTFAGDDLSKILEGIRGKYGHLTGLSMDYTREVITRSMSMLGNQIKGDSAKGRIYFRPPYSMRLEQKTPQRETIIADGETLWWYVPHKKSAHQYPFKEFGKELRLLSDIFRGLTRVEENFKVEMGAKSEQGEYQIQLTPDPPWQEINGIILTVTREYDIRVVNIHNQLGSITRFTLEGLTAKETFDKGFFRFALPEGVQLIDETAK
ncbi:MAG: outer membrane lipoprotein carrier protein LolA [Deltaproteobacteria bacterium]|nr:outer membrane lipoprotein carrier protein LolA [Deltaproteobacteria bacterium]